MPTAQELNIPDKLDSIMTTKQAIHDAIVAKGVEVPEGTTFREYADCVHQIRSEQIVSGHVTIEQVGTSSIPIDGTLVVASAMVPASGVKLVVTPDSPSHYYGSDGIVYDPSENRFDIVIASPAIVGFTFDYIIVTDK